MRDRQLVIAIERQLDARLALLLAVHRLGRLPIVVAQRCLGFLLFAAPNRGHRWRFAVD